MASEAEAFSEWDSESEAAEAASRRPIRKPSNQSSFKARPAPNAPQYVTQAQLQASLKAVDGKIGTLSSSVGTLTSRQTQLQAGLKKEAQDRKTAGDSANKDLNQKLQLLALLPVLIQPPTQQIFAATTSGGANTSSFTVDAQDPSQLDSLLPLLLVSGLGGSGGLGLGGDSSSGGDSSILLLALVLAFANKS